MKSDFCGVAVKPQDGEALRFMDRLAATVVTVELDRKHASSLFC